MEPLVVSAFTMTSPIGRGLRETLASLRERRGGLRPNDFCAVPTHVGRVAGLEEAALGGRLTGFDCRNNRLAALGLEHDGFAEHVTSAVARYGAERIGVFVGTSTSGVLETELAYRRLGPDVERLPSGFPFRYTHNIQAPSAFVRTRFELRGPAFAISTACSSSAKAFATAFRHIAAGICDAAVVGGVDSLCHSTLHGFNALELTSPLPCRPADVARDGVSIGEAAAYAFIERADRASACEMTFLGYGESMDAHHMSTPHPEGLGARLAMERALSRAALAPARVDYVNLHGTATPINDAVEDRAVAALFGDDIVCSSTKGWTGHLLGAAGAGEAVLTGLCLREQFIPGTLNTARVDPAFRCRIALENRTAPLRVALSNSFGFGGNNCSLLFGRGS